jgi:hydrogenase expression/formation protein HypE
MKPNIKFLPVGKLSSDLLARLLKSYTSLDARVKVGPSIGEDAAAVDMGDGYLLLKTDPITFVAEDIGTYAVRINANDIATMGGKPQWLLDYKGYSKLSENPMALSLGMNGCPERSKA